MTRGLPSRLPVVQQQPEQLRFAHVLQAGTWLGLLLLAASFGAYVLGLLPSRVPLQRMPALWGLPLPRFVDATASPTGWHWLALLGHGDAAALLGVAVLSGCSLGALVALLPIYLRRGDRAYALLCAAELGALALAASGVLTFGH